MLDDLLRQSRTNALDQPRAQVPADALHGRGQHGDVVLDVELPPELRMRTPPAPHPQRLTRLRSQQRSDHGDQIPTMSRVNPSDGVARVGVGERDPLQSRLQHRSTKRLRHACPSPEFLRATRCPRHIYHLPDNTSSPDAGPWGSSRWIVETAGTVYGEHSVREHDNSTERTIGPTTRRQACEQGKATSSAAAPATVVHASKRGTDEPDA